VVIDLMAELRKSLTWKCDTCGHAETARPAEEAQRPKCRHYSRVCGACTANGLGITPQLLAMDCVTCEDRADGSAAAVAS
jgi:hypothetical protein